MNASLAAAKDISIDASVAAVLSELVCFFMQKNKTLPLSLIVHLEYVLNVLLTTGFGNSVVRSCGGSPESDDRSLMCSFALIESLQLRRLNWQKKKKKK